MKLVPGTELKKGKYYRLVKSGKLSSEWVGVAFLMVGHVRRYTTKTAKVHWLEEAVCTDWCLFKIDKYEQMSDEEATLYKLGR